jgi:6-phosphofructokinase 1
MKTGEKAVQAALKGKTGKMIIFERVSQNPYKIKYKLAPLSKVANAVSHVKPEMIIDATRMSDSFRDYLRPLIQGEVKLVYKDGIAPVTNFKRIKVK